jgi:HK97 family phage prohead protease
MLFLKSYAGTSAVEDEAKGIVHAVISCYGIEDGDGDTMIAGAFKKSIDLMKGGGFRPVGLAYHDLKRPVAKTLDAYEQGSEVHVIGQFNLETQDGREVFSNIKNGVVQTYSHAFVKPVIERKDFRKRNIHGLEWKEWSPVAVPALDATRTVWTKALLRDGSTFAEEAEMALAAVEDLVSRAEEIAALRKSDDRTISKESRQLIGELKGRIDALLVRADAPEAEAVNAERLRAIRNQKALRDLLIGSL